MREALAEILAVAEVRLDPSQPYDPGYFFAVTHPAKLAAEIELALQSLDSPSRVASVRSRLGKPCDRRSALRVE